MDRFQTVSRFRHESRPRVFRKTRGLFVLYIRLSTLRGAYFFRNLYSREAPPVQSS